MSGDVEAADREQLHRPDVRQLAHRLPVEPGLVGERHRGHRPGALFEPLHHRRVAAGADERRQHDAATDRQEHGEHQRAAPPSPGVVAAPTPTTRSCRPHPDRRRSSSTIRPSRIATVRWAAAAMARSWVTITIVWPASLRRRNSCSTSAPPSVSRAPGRLVGQQHRRRVGHRPGDRQPLALAARQARRQGVDLVGEAEQVEQLAGPPPGGAARRPAEHRRDGDVLGRRHRLEQVEELEDDADGVAPDDRPLVGSERAEHVAGDLDDAVIGDLEPGDDRQQRRLPAPRRTGDGDELAGRDVEVGAAAGRAPARVSTSNVRNTSRDVDDRGRRPPWSPFDHVADRCAGRVVPAAADRAGPRDICGEHRWPADGAIRTIGMSNHRRERRRTCTETMAEHGGRSRVPRALLGVWR